MRKSNGVRFLFLPPACLSLMLAWLALVTSPSPAQEKGKKPPAESKHVLFIGNSYTFRNGLPNMIAELAKAGKEIPLTVESETPGGCTLEKHWTDGKALAKIKSRKWDFVVLQEQSTSILQHRDSTFNHAKLFDAEIKKNGSTTILYMTWARQGKPDDQRAISGAFLDLSKELKCPIAPVGEAWDAALKADKERVLHADDMTHPSPTGTYLAACVFYATIYGKSPEGLPGKIENTMVSKPKTAATGDTRADKFLSRLKDDEALPLQTIAWKAVQAIKK